MAKPDFRTPGQLVAALLKDRGWTKRVLALVLDVSDPTVSKIISGKRQMDGATALALGEVFGVEPERFLDLQTSYDLALARLETPPDPKRAVRAQIYGGLPIPEMIRRGWLDTDDFRDTDAVENELCRFFRVNRIEDAPAFSFAAKKSEVGGEATPSQLAWFYRVKAIASGMMVGPYSAQKVEAAIDKIKPLRGHPEHMRRVPRILAEAGIRFVVSEGLSGGRIDGVCFWLDDRSPVIGMTLRFDRIDNFLFVLRHELEHVRNRDGLDTAMLDTDLDKARANDGSDIADQEHAADAAAQEFCVPKKSMDAFVLRKAPYFSDRDVVGFARTLKVHPGLVAGQLQRRTGRYNYFRKHLVGVREFVLPTAEADGWGDIHPIDA